jgi:hypothetical protein
MHLGQWQLRCRHRPMRGHDERPKLLTRPASPRNRSQGGHLNPLKGDSRCIVHCVAAHTEAQRNFSPTANARLRLGSRCGADADKQRGQHQNSSEVSMRQAGGTEVRSLGDPFHPGETGLPGGFSRMIRCHTICVDQRDCNRGKPESWSRPRRARLCPEFWSSVRRKLRVQQGQYCRLAGAVFAIVAVLQLVRSLAGWPVTVAGAAIPVWASWIAFVLAGALAWAGFAASRR